MPQIEIYTKFLCPYCSRAKALLARKGATYLEIDITMDAPRRSEMIDRANGQTTVPQIFINGSHVGGSDDLATLDMSGKLDLLLSGDG